MRARRDSFEYVLLLVLASAGCVPSTQSLVDTIGGFTLFGSQRDDARREALRRRRNSQKTMESKEASVSEKARAQKELAVLEGAETRQMLRAAWQAGGDSGVLALLLEIGDEEVIEEVRQAMDGDDVKKRANIREKLALAMQSGQCNIAEEALVGRLHDPDYPYRGELARCLARCHEDRSVPGLEQFVSDQDPEVRAAVLEGLGARPSESTVEVLLGGLESNDAVSREAAVRGMGKLVEGLQWKRLEALASCKERIGQLRGDPDARVRLAFVNMHMYMKWELSPLLPLARDADTQVRRKTLAVLAGRPPQEAFDVFACTARLEEDLELRVLALSGLGACGEERAVPILIEGLRHESADVRAAAACGLGRLWKPPRWSKQTPLQSDRGPAVRALSEILTDDSVPRNTSSSTRSSIREMAAWTLANMEAGEAVPALIEAIEATPGEELSDLWIKHIYSDRASMLRALVKMRDQRAAPYLKKVHEDDQQPLEIRLIAGGGLRELGSPPQGLEQMRGTARRRREAQKWSERRRLGWYPDSGDVTFGLAPAAAISRSGLSSDLDLDGPGALDISSMIETEGVTLLVSLGYAPLLESGTGSSGDLARFDFGAGQGHGFRNGCALLATGPSVMFLDLEGGERNMFGVGWFVRASVHLGIWRAWGLELCGNAHGWVGGGGDGWHVACEASLGLNIAHSF